MAPSPDAAAAFLAVQPQVSVQSVTISSPPVVKFMVKDANGNGIVGLGSKAQSATAIVANLTNLNFTLAKLVPGTNGSPSKWVSYIVTKPPTVAQTAGTVTASASCDSTTKPTVCGAFPSADTQGTLVDNGDGSYQYTFYRDVKQAAAQVASLIDSADGLSKKADLGDVSYDPSLTHRLGIFVAGSMPGTGTNTPNAAASATPAVPLVFTANIGYDFVPAGGTPSVTRDIVVATSCDGCHDNVTLKKGIGHISYSTTANGIPAGSAVGRNDPRLCVSCHTDQTKYGFPEAKTTATGYDDTDPNGYKRVNGEAAFTYPRMIHQTHMGDQLVKTGYNLNAHAKKANGTTGCDFTTNVNRGQCFNLVGFPQDQRNCTKCHDGSATKSDGSVNANKTTDGDNWKKVPSRLACGACHDGINFATGKGITLANRDADVAAGNPVGTTATGHVGGARADDSLCAVCHDSTTIPVYHETTVASLNNPVVKAGVASFVFKISSATINSSKLVVVKFQILKNGTAVALNPYAAGAVPLTGYTDGPTFQVAYATGQDGIAAPTDWNSGHDTLTLADAWAGANGNTLSGPDSSNTYTVTIASSSKGQYSSVHSLALGADAKMVTVLMAGAFTDPTVADNGGALPGVPVMVTATGNTPDGKPNAARRVVFSESKCNNCHDRLGTSPNFHGGNYSIAMCSTCHTPNQGGSAGWSVSFRVWVHGIHGASKRTVPFTWHAVSATDNYSTLQYPGVLKDCNQCHLPGTYDFSASQYTPDLIAGMLNVQAATGKLNPASATAFVFPQAGPVGSGNWAYGLKVDNSTDYGTGWSVNPATGTLVAPTTQGNNLVTSPITAVCSACHDTATATSHMEANGGSFYDPRSAALTRSEQCLVCHASGKIADISAVHKQ